MGMGGYWVPIAGLCYECLIRFSLCYFIYRTIAPIEKFVMKFFAEATYNSLPATSYLTASIFDSVDLISTSTSLLHYICPNL